MSVCFLLTSFTLNHVLELGHVAPVKLFESDKKSTFSILSNSLLEHASENDLKRFQIKIKLLMSKWRGCFGIDYCSNRCFIRLGRLSFVLAFKAYTDCTDCFKYFDQI